MHEEQYNLLRKGERGEPLTERQLKERENLEVNPFPGILTDKEFELAKREGEGFLNEWLSRKKEERQRNLREGREYSALISMRREQQVLGGLLRGEVAESYKETIFASNRSALSTSQDEKAKIVSTFLEGIRVRGSGYGEEIFPEILHRLYKKDPSGKKAIEYIAAHKALDANLEAGEDSFDVISLDTGVFVSLGDAPRVYEHPGSPRSKSLRPTHLWLRKPTSAAEMTKMLHQVNGKTVEVVTAIALAFGILKGGPRWAETKMVEIPLEVRSLSDTEINEFVKSHLSEGLQVAGGVDYATYGANILKAPDLSEQRRDFLKGVPLAEIRKLWASVQVMKRAAQLDSVRRSGHEGGKNKAA